MIRRLARTFPIRDRRDVATTVAGLVTGVCWWVVGLPTWPLYFLPVVLFVVLFVYFMWVRPRHDWRRRHRDFLDKTFPDEDYR